MRPVVVTGATSFLGMELCAALSGAGRDVHALVRPNSDTHRLEDRAAGTKIHRAEPTVAALTESLSTLGDATVVHLAAKYLRRHAPDDVDTLLDANIGFGLRLVEAMKATGQRRLVNTGTFFQHLDSDGYRPVNLYAATKQAFETLIEFHVDAGLIDAATLVLFDVYGEGDWRSKFLDIVTNTQRADRPSEIGLPSTDAEIDLVHISDVVSAYALAIELLEAGSINGHERFAVTTGEPRKLSEVVATAESVGGRPVTIDRGRYPDAERTPTTLWNGPTLPGWIPLVDLEQGIRKMIDAGKEG